MDADHLWVWNEEKPHDEEDDDGSDSRDHLQVLPVALAIFFIAIREGIEHDGCELDAGNVTEVIACAPETDEHPAVFLRKPVSHDGDHARQKERIEYTNEYLHEVKVDLAVDCEEAGKTQQEEEDTEPCESYREHLPLIV